MAKSAKPLFIGIKELWYCDSLTEALTPAKLAAAIKAAGTKKVTNSHQDTFQYEQEDGEQTEYINELDGETYYVDPTAQGKRTISFTVGQYDYADKAALQGGKVIEDTSKNAIGWSAPSTIDIIHKAVIARVKSGNFVVFTNANIVAKTTMAEKNMGLGVVATALKNETDGVESEYWFTGANVDAELAKLQ